MSSLGNNLFGQIANLVVSIVQAPFVLSSQIFK